jgi:RHS repeat-associated protein
LLQHFYSFSPDSGRLASVSDGTHSATYGYLDNSSLVEQIQFQQGTTTRMTTTKSYDGLNRLTNTVSSAGGSNVVCFAYTYNSANQRTSVTNVDGSYWVYAYDDLGQVESGKKYWADGTPVAGQQFEYGFDDIGNRETATRDGRQSDYSANFLNQYESRTVPGYVNILGQATNTATVTVNLQATSRKGDYFRAELQVSNSVPLWLGVTNIAVLQQGTNADIIATNLGHLLIPQTPEAFTHDADGNLTSDSLWTNTWNAENRRTLIESRANLLVGGRAREQWTHLPDGRWIERIVSTNNGSGYVPAFTNRYVWDGNVLLAVLDAAGNVLQAYTRGLDLSGSHQGAGGVGGLLWVSAGTNGTHFACFDGNGNVIALVDASTGAESARYEYGPFSEDIRATGPMARINSLRFSTQYADDITGDLKYLYRDYRSDLGRWLNRDPLGELGAANLYGFVGNDAVNGVDFLGLVNIIRLGFKGAGGTEGEWLMGLGPKQRFGSQSVMQALWYIFRELDTNKDGQINDCDDEADIRVTGFSWGGWSALQLAKQVNDTKVIKSQGMKHRSMRLGLLDPVNTARNGSGSVTPNVYFALNIFQKNGCYGGRCPGPSSWYKGESVTGAANVDVTNDRPTSPVDGGQWGRI